MFSTSRALVARGLAEYGEEAVAEWVSGCDDDDFHRVCGVADWLLSDPSGCLPEAGFTPVAASSIAAVFVHDGHPRKLARSRRRKLPELSREEALKLSFSGSPSSRDLAAKGNFYGVTEEFKAFWQQARRPGRA